MKASLVTILTSVTLLCHLQGCATIKGRNAYVKIVSDPPAAEVLLNGETSLGWTPLFATIPRARKSFLVIRTDKNKKRIDFTSSYRWQESFLANLIWISPVFWGIGWGTDLLSGASWDYEPLPVLRLPDSDPSVESARDSHLTLPVKRIAIAPPLAENEMLSAKIALKIQQALQKKFPLAEIRPFDDTSDTFAAFNFTYANENTPNLDDQLYHELNVTHVIRSEVERVSDEDITHTRVSLHDIYLNKDVRDFKLVIAQQRLATMNARGFRHLL